MQVQYWAKYRKTLIGPFETREAALGSMYDRMADKRPLPDYMARSQKHRVTTGYGTFGPDFDIRWHDAYSETMAKRDLGVQ